MKFSFKIYLYKKHKNKPIGYIGWCTNQDGQASKFNKRKIQQFKNPKYSITRRNYCARLR